MVSTAALERACALNPLDGESWSLLGCNRRQQSDLDGAARAFERAASLSAETNFGALMNLAAVRSAQQRPADALAALQKALAIGAPPSLWPFTSGTSDGEGMYSMTASSTASSKSWTPNEYRLKPTSTRVWR
jgi:cytochrome c-type biogenesis protein CcmH/NrfG